MPLPILKIRRMIWDRKIIGAELDLTRTKKWYRGYCPWCGEDQGFLAFSRRCITCDLIMCELEAYYLRKTHDPDFKDGD